MTITFSRTWAGDCLSFRQQKLPGQGLQRPTFPPRVRAAPGRRALLPYHRSLAASGNEAPCPSPADLSSAGEFSLMPSDSPESSLCCTFSIQDTLLITIPPLTPGETVLHRGLPQTGWFGVFSSWFWCCRAFVCLIVWEQGRAYSGIVYVRVFGGVFCVLGFFNRGSSITVALDQ